jgi:hypothetical protein
VNNKQTNKQKETLSQTKKRKNRGCGVAGNTKGAHVCICARECTLKTCVYFGGADGENDSGVSCGALLLPPPTHTPESVKRNVKRKKRDRRSDISSGFQANAR